ncbi:MAG TPA: RNA 2',3'-cyclic phosphodiesterase [Noviherbaspirillum sp.]|uniref:RNA 2',3'-cyclic phosphodiesterase n=1 Tax=Noviherbaspirillum sp. TaxID=1926288 RepID=UPI002D262A3A|nr:RNA 2',3'-cyclic phosphodiesterase [Noviherbaspirillum sp.]HYD96636.1 RNA 2',3'-cyclic phosphodiesterase [Noviherbaspirillum sp.]
MNARTPDTLRLFYALWPDDATASALLQLQAPMRGRRIPYSNLHMTLAFLGQQPAALLPQLTDILTHLPTADITLRLDRVGYFPRNRIAWVGPSEAPEELFALQRRLVGDLNEHKVAFKGQHGYRPHVTLARDATLPQDLAFDPIAWQATEAALVQSTTTPEGSVYKILASRRIDREVWIPAEARSDSVNLPR